jgi:predicted O-methyltransferase YrrM
MAPLDRILSMPAARRLGRRLFYGHVLARRAGHLVLWAQDRRTGYELSHLSYFDEEDAVGSVQRDEALLLFGLVRVLRPQVVVELGFLGGQGAFNLLQALAPGATLYCFDISEASEAIAREAFGRFENLRFRRLSQDEIAPEHLDGRAIDLVFLDASHDLELNKRTLDRLVPMLSRDGIIAVHDTGAWARPTFGPLHRGIAHESPHLWATAELFEHQREERAFVNWVLEARPELAQIHLHSRHTVRHGMTLLQRRAPLPTAAT